MDKRTMPMHATEDTGWVVKTDRWIRAESYKYWTPISPVLMAIWGGVAGDNPFTWIWLAGGILTGIFAVILRPRKPTYTQLKLDLAHLKTQYESRGKAVERALESLLQKIAMHCEANTHNERVSAYYFQDNEFYMIARYSRNPELRTPGRRRYPVNQGAIGEAWADPNGVCVKEFPVKREPWLLRMQKNGFSSVEANNLTMQARVIAAMRVEGQSGSVGALVFESNTKDHIGANTLDVAQGSLVYEAIVDFISANARDTPRAVHVGVGEQPSLYDRNWKTTPISEDKQPAPGFP